jgi:fatty-acyl-CoA synthase
MIQLMTTPDEREGASAAIRTLLSDSNSAAPVRAQRLARLRGYFRSAGLQGEDGVSHREVTMDDASRLSYGNGPSDQPLIGETIGANIAATAAAFGGREALVDVPSGQRWTYAQLNADADALASGLIAAGIAAGDRVGIWSPNGPEWVLLQYATAKMGAILVNINPAYRSHELAFVLRQSGVRMLVSAQQFKTSDYRAMIDEVRGDLPGLRQVVYLGTGDWTGLAAGRGTTGQQRDVLGRRAAELSFDDPINIQYTSGTTGFPKGATLSHHNILNNGYFIGELCRYTEQDRVAIPVPFYHCFGMVLGNLACTTHGACIVIPAPGFDPAASLRAVQSERCTALYGVPTMFIAELSLPDFADYDLSSLRTGIMAGSPCPVEVMKRVVSEMHMTEVTICYGMTETSPVSTQTSADDDMERRVSTVGRVHPHLEVKITDPETGLVAPRGTPGELCTRGYSVMLGYWDEPAKTAEVIDAARWMHTGDLATMDEAGYVNIVGRIKDMIIRGGENVYPREVEEFLYTHPAVEDVQVIGVPDARYGEELCAWVRLRPGQDLTEEELKAYCAGQIAHFKVPRYVRFTDEFPLTVTGKVQKFKMREISTAELGLETTAGTHTA